MKSVVTAINRITKHMSVTVVAEHMGVSRQMVYKWMDGAVPDKDKIDRLFALEEDLNDADYDVVVDVLQTHHDKLWKMTHRKGELEWGAMDFIRLEQMNQLDAAIKLWRQRNDRRRNPRRVGSR